MKSVLYLPNIHKFSKVLSGHDYLTPQQITPSACHQLNTTSWGIKMWNGISPIEIFKNNQQQRKWDFALLPIPWTKQEQIMLLKVWLHQNQNAHYTNLLHSLLCFEKF